MPARSLAAIIAAVLIAAPALAQAQHIEMGACPGKEPELMKLMRAYTDCVTDKVDAMTDGGQTADVIAAAAEAACAGRTGPIETFYKDCKLGDPRLAQIHDRVVEGVNEKRHPARADRAWIEMAGADTGACRMNAPQFSPVVKAHLDCMFTNFAKDGDASVGFGGFADRSLEFCAREEAALRPRIAQCTPAHADTMMTSYRAYAREWMVSSVLFSVLRDDPDQILPDPRTRTEEIEKALVSYLGCFIVETRLRVLAGSGKQAAQAGAAEACRDEGNEMARIAQDRLGEAGEAAFRHQAVMEAVTFATQGLPADARP